MGAEEQLAIHRWAQVSNRFGKTVQRMLNVVLTVKGMEHSVAEDVLRASIIYLHAALEELLRDAARIKCDSCRPETFRRFRFTIHAGKKISKKERITVADLCQYRGQTVNEILGNMLEKHLETRSFSKVRQVVQWLRNIEVDVPEFANFAGDLADLLARRHSIVHRADILTDGNVLQLDVEAFTKWIYAIGNLGGSVLVAIAPPGTPAEALDGFKSVFID